MAHSGGNLNLFLIWIKIKPFPCLDFAIMLHRKQANHVNVDYSLFPLKLECCYKLCTKRMLLQVEGNLFDPSCQWLLPITVIFHLISVYFLFIFYDLSSIMEDILHLNRDF